jgi:hypothetical protein
MAEQSIDGNQNVQIWNVGVGATVTVTTGGEIRDLPLQRAGIHLGPGGSPSQLVRARYRVIPYPDHTGLLHELEDWTRSSDPFAACLVGGRGGGGKTRMATELCERK